jgi:hypothetical protein
MSYWNGSEWGPEQSDPPKRSTRRRRFFGATLEATLIVALTFGLIAGTAFAAKGGAGKGPSGGGSGLSLVVIDSVDGVPHFGQRVTFDVTTGATQPQVNVSCYQNGTRVYDEWHGFFEDAWFGQIFTLGPTPSWTGGDADCTARLVTFSKNGRLNVHATTTFHAYP